MATKELITVTPDNGSGNGALNVVSKANLTEHVYESTFKVSGGGVREDF